MEQMLFNLWNGLNQRKPEYKKVQAARKINGEILESVYNAFDGEPAPYFFNLRTSLETCYKKRILPDPNLYSFQSDNESSYLTRVLLYFGQKDDKTIVESFVEKHKFRKPEKVLMLEAMKNSVVSLFTFQSFDQNTLSIVLKDMKTKKEYTITDLGLSFSLQHMDASKKCIAGVIITYNDVSFIECSSVFDRDLRIAKKLEDSFLHKNLPPMLMLLTAYKIAENNETIER